MRPLISVIIPVYNHAHILERCLKSIEQQTYRPLEVIVVNDGSADNFKEVVKKITFSLPLKIVNQENKGAAAARNRGFREASGGYVIFWDADTVGKPEMLERLARQLREYPEASYAYCQFRFGWKKMKSQPFSSEDLKRYNYIDTTSLVTRGALDSLLERRAREVLYDGEHTPTPLSRGEAAGPFDEKLKRFMDWDLWLTLFEQGKRGVLVPEVLYTKIVLGRKGISSWLPRWAYKLPWKPKRVLQYEAAKDIILAKHGIQ